MYFPPNTPSRSISSGVSSGLNSGSNLRPAAAVSASGSRFCILSLTVTVTGRRLGMKRTIKA